MSINGKRRHVVVDQVLMLIVADDNQDVGTQRRDFLAQPVDGGHAAFPFGPFHFVRLGGQFRFVR